MTAQRMIGVPSSINSWADQRTDDDLQSVLRLAHLHPLKPATPFMKELA